MAKVKAKIDAVIAEQNKVDATPSMQTSVVLVDKTEVRAPGRPVVPGSKRQLELQEKQARRESNGGLIPKGRPIDPNSKKYQREQRLAYLKSIGLGNPGQSAMYLTKHGLLNEDGTINEAKCKEFHGIKDEVAVTETVAE